MTINNLSPQQLRKAADIQERILKLQAELNAMFGAPAATPAQAKQAAAPAKPAKKRRLSPEGRARIIAAAKERWRKERAKKAGKSS